MGCALEAPDKETLKKGLDQLSSNASTFINETSNGVILTVISQSAETGKQASGWYIRFI